MPHINMLTRCARIYVNTTLAYGFARAVTYEYEGTKNYYNNKTAKYEQKEMLLIDKIGRASASSVSAIFLWPIMLNDDLARLECAVRGKDLAEYTRR